MRRSITWGVAAASVALALALVTFLREPGKAAGENGTFAHDCCGTVQLVDGAMLLNDRETVRYTVAKDADGPYILPRAYVGTASDQGLEVDGTRSVVKLRLDKLPVPTRILLYQGLRPYVFTRQASRLRR